MTCAFVCILIYPCFPIDHPQECKIRMWTYKKCCSFFFHFTFIFKSSCFEKCILKYKMGVYTFWDALDDPVCIQVLAKFRSVAWYKSRCSSLIYSKDNTSSIITSQYGQVISALARYLWVGNVLSDYYICLKIINPIQSIILYKTNEKWNISFQIYTFWTNIW